MESLACPVSCITPESKRDLGRFYQQERAHKATGGVLYGADSADWNCRWFDAVNIIQAEIERANGAFERAKAAYVASKRNQ